MADTKQFDLIVKVLMFLPKADQDEIVSKIFDLLQEKTLCGKSTVRIPAMVEDALPRRT
jgi:hypothetical protein